MHSFKLKRILKRATTVVVSLAILVASMTLLVPEDSYDVAALTSSELKEKIAGYERKQSEIQAKIDALQDDKTDAQEKSEQLEEQVSILEDKVSLISNRVDSLQAEIASKQSDINTREAKIKDAKELLKQRLRAIYIAGASSEILVLLSAEDYGDFLEKSDVMKCITSDTKELMTKLEGQIKKINKAKKQVEADKAEADSLKQQLVTEQNALDAKYEEAQAAYNKLASTESSLEKESEEIAAAKEKAEAEFDELAKQQAQNSSVGTVTIDGGNYGFAWPYSGSYYISSGYGWRWGKLHGGVDITGGGAYGKPIYAMADGRVFLASYYSSYGNCVMIDHGSMNGVGISSLYAHCSSLAVSNGQSVTKGQVIAYVGSTGHSTGPHLHFEIRENGNRVNPLNYYKSY